MWFGENEKRARNSEGLNKQAEKNVNGDDHGNAPLQSSFENLLDRPTKQIDSSAGKVNAYPY